MCLSCKNTSLMFSGFVKSLTPTFLQLLIMVSFGSVVKAYMVGSYLILASLSRLFTFMPKRVIMMERSSRSRIINL